LSFLAAHSGVEHYNVQQSTGTHPRRACAARVGLRAFPDFSGRFCETPVIVKHFAQIATPRPRRAGRLRRHKFGVLARRGADLTPNPPKIRFNRRLRAISVPFKVRAR
jgi:hypothetical protein